MGKALRAFLRTEAGRKEAAQIRPKAPKILQVCRKFLQNGTSP